MSKRDSGHSSNPVSKITMPPIKARRDAKYLEVIRRQDQRDTEQMLLEQTKEWKDFIKYEKYVERTMADKEKHTMGSRDAVPDFENIPNDFFPEEDPEHPGMSLEVSLSDQGIRAMTDAEYQEVIRRQDQRDTEQMLLEQTKEWKDFIKYEKYVERTTADQEKHTMGNTIVTDFENMTDDMFPEEDPEHPGMSLEVSEAVQDKTRR